MPAGRRRGRIAAPCHAIIIIVSSPITYCGGAIHGGCGGGSVPSAGRTLGPPIRRVRRRQGGVLRAGRSVRPAARAADARAPPPPPAHRRPPGKGRASGRRHPAGGEGGARGEPLPYGGRGGAADLGARPAAAARTRGALAAGRSGCRRALHTLGTYIASLGDGRPALRRRAARRGGHCTKSEREQNGLLATGQRQEASLIKSLRK